MPALYSDSETTMVTSTPVPIHPRGSSSLGTGRRSRVRGRRLSSGLNTMPEKLFKVIVIGDPTVGKTSFVQRYVQNTYRKDYKGTVGVDFALKILKLGDSQTVKLQLWDIAGQERFTWMTRVYYKDAHGCVIMFDLTNKNSFVNTLKWKKDVDSKCTLPDGSPIPCMLLANKCDLQSQRQVDQMEIETFYKQHNFIGWTETSPKEGLMVNDSMRFLVDVMIKQEGNQSFSSSESSEYISLTGPGPQSKKSCSC
ncbi:ras-related protein Rab-7L1-like [Macrosteles quadrilineatus]|uniref:ras-related protein Rab-7L1-like n=1 Tax=Macrosteles quadrilineatus TaxID=74068 RepID=UPI0023E349B9|nr:ras-related protein Rab-7L1-like [Macrosteles quadrilineatus]